MLHRVELVVWDHMLAGNTIRIENSPSVASIVASIIVQNLNIWHAQT